MSWVPVVDLAGDPEVVCAAVAEACERVGFLTVINHGVEPYVLAAAWTEARKSPSDRVGQPPLSASAEDRWHSRGQSVRLPESVGSRSRTGGR